MYLDLNVEFLLTRRHIETLPSSTKAYRLQAICGTGNVSVMMRLHLPSGQNSGTGFLIEIPLY